MNTLPTKQEKTMKQIALKSKIILSTIIVLLCAQVVSAKDGISAGLEFGGVGSEKKFTNSSDSYSDTYTMTTFDPELQFRFDLPVADIKDNCFLNINLDYKFSWYNSNSSDLTIYAEQSRIDHSFTLQPELVFSKEDFRFFFGTGITFILESYESEVKTTTSKQTAEYKNYIFRWDFELGAKYYLNDHISVLADFTISLPFSILQRDGSVSTTQSGKTTTKDYADTNTHGSSAMYFSPKVGISYTF